MQNHTVDQTLTFSFPDDWHISQYDEWAFYRNRFSKMHEGIKGVDLLAVDPASTAWFIEVKDYRKQSRTKPLPLAEEIFGKVYDTLAAIVPAKCNAENEEQSHAEKVAHCKKIRVVLHLEQPPVPSKLFPKKFDLSNVQQQLRIRLKPIDAHPYVIDSQTMPIALPWSVRP